MSAGTTDMHIATLTGAVLAASLSRSFAAAPDSVCEAREPVGSVLASDGCTFIGGIGHVLSAPGRWEGGEWILAGSLVGGTVASSVIDPDARKFVLRNRSVLNDRISDVAVGYGSGLPVLGLTAGVYGMALLLGERWIRETALLGGTAILVAATLSTATKIAVGRGRPNLGEGNWSVRPFSFDDGHESFPSGHTIVAFAVSGTLAERIKNTWASIGLYGIAAATGWSRMYTDHHWFSDVLFGAVISISVSRSLVHWFEGCPTDERISGIRIIPKADGVTVLYRF
jgi:membrane-associated phospholipid phosphatase